MKNWKTNLGGAISITGTSLIGIGVLSQLTQISSTSILTPGQLAAMWYVALAGFILSAIGKGVASLFAADASNVNNIAKAVDLINQKGPSSDTTILAKPEKPIAP